MLNDTPVACQIRGPTDPQGDRWHGEAVTDEVSPPQRRKRSICLRRGYFAPRRERFLLSPPGIISRPQAVSPQYHGGVSRHLPIAVLRAAMGAI